MHRICVFCGSSPGNKPVYSEASSELGKKLVANNLELVFGGGGGGLMGKLARAALAEGGNVIGIIPKSIADKEVALTTLPDLRIVGSMHERKALMAELSDGFIALPGGIGTLEEFIEILTWSQLGFHKKPCGLLNTNNYFNKLINFLQHMADEDFLETTFLDHLIIDSDPQKLLNRFKTYMPPNIDKAAWAIS